MGFYDLRCALTGLSLKGQSCDVLLLRRHGGALVPVWGAITGRYNRVGSIDDPPPRAAELAHLRAALATHAAGGRLVETGDAPAPGEPFFERFEPNRHLVQLDGEPLVMTLVHHRIAAYLVRELGDGSAPPDRELFARAFPTMEPIAPYAELGLGRGLTRLLAVRRWLGAEPFPLPSGGEQHTSDDVARSVRDAKKRAPTLREAIEWAETEDYAR